MCLHVIVPCKKAIFHPPNQPNKDNPKQNIIVPPKPPDPSNHDTPNHQSFGRRAEMEEDLVSLVEDSIAHDTGQSDFACKNGPAYYRRVLTPGYTLPFVLSLLCGL